MTDEYAGGDQYGPMRNGHHSNGEDKSHDPAKHTKEQAHQVHVPFCASFV
ncbi:hypothetical protein ACN9MB_20490 [Dyella kyungheensis]